jgi:hypothetical protein
MLLSKTEDRSSDAAKLLEWKLQTFIKQLAEDASLQARRCCPLFQIHLDWSEVLKLQLAVVDFLFLTTCNPVVFL